jgi:uncharacterized protein YndB with AHSA1/START domain
MTREVAEANDTVVRTSVTVAAPVEKAFAVFTDGFDGWWPRSHHLGEGELAEAVLETKTGGRWYERLADGSECEWGTVLVCEPPHRLVLSWAISPSWAVETDTDRASTVEVRFVAEGDGRTRVELEHRDLDRHGADWQKMRDSIASDGGWTGILRGYAAEAEGKAA